MEKSINERIELLYKYSGERRVRSYAIKMKIAPTTLNECIKGAEPRFSLLIDILNGNPSISSEWLMRGTGDMLLSENAQKDTLISSSDSYKEEEVNRLKEENIKLKEDISYLKGYNAAIIDQFCPKKEDREGKSA